MERLPWTSQLFYTPLSLLFFPSIYSFNYLFIRLANFGFLTRFRLTCSYPPAPPASQHIPRKIATPRKLTTSRKPAATPPEPVTPRTPQRRRAEPHYTQGNVNAAVDRCRYKCNVKGRKRNIPLLVLVRETKKLSSKKSLCKTELVRDAHILSVSNSNHEPELKRVPVFNPFTSIHTNSINNTTSINKHSKNTLLNPNSKSQSKSESPFLQRQFF